MYWKLSLSVDVDYQDSSEMKEMYSTATSKFMVAKVKNKSNS